MGLSTGDNAQTSAQTTKEAESESESGSIREAAEPKEVVASAPFADALRQAMQQQTPTQQQQCPTPTQQCGVMTANSSSLSRCSEEQDSFRSSTSSGCSPEQRQLAQQEQEQGEEAQATGDVEPQDHQREQQRQQDTPSVAAGRERLIAPGAPKRRLQLLDLQQLPAAPPPPPATPTLAPLAASLGAVVVPLSAVVNEAGGLAPLQPVAAAAPTAASAYALPTTPTLGTSQPIHIAGPPSPLALREESHKRQRSGSAS